MSTTETVQASIKHLLKRARIQGFIPFAEIDDLLLTQRFDNQQRATILSMIENLGVSVRDVPDELKQKQTRLSEDFPANPSRHSTGRGDELDALDLERRMASVEAIAACESLLAEDDNEAILRELAELLGLGEARGYVRHADIHEAFRRCGEAGLLGGDERYARLVETLEKLGIRVMKRGPHRATPLP